MQTNSLFVDTSGWMAYLSADETYHDQAGKELRQAMSRSDLTIYSTDYVLAELVALMTVRRIPRQQIVTAMGVIINASRITKLFTDQALFFEAWNLLTTRLDKDWSLADSVAICRMQQLGVTEALTNDHHFARAGFILLLT